MAQKNTEIYDVSEINPQDFSEDFVLRKETFNLNTDFEVYNPKSGTEKFYITSKIQFKGFSDIIIKGRRPTQRKIMIEENETNKDIFDAFRKVDQFLNAYTLFDNFTHNGLVREKDGKNVIFIGLPIDINNTILAEIKGIHFNQRLTSDQFEDIFKDKEIKLVMSFKKLWVNKKENIYGWTIGASGIIPI